MAKNLNKVQSQLLLDRMSENEELANGKRANRAEFNAFWYKLHLDLNKAGPPEKCVSEWKKVWADQKRYVRKKAEQTGDLSPSSSKRLKLSKSFLASTQSTPNGSENLMSDVEQFEEFYTSNENIECESNVEKCGPRCTRVLVKNAQQLEKNNALNTECTNNLMNVAQAVEKCGPRCSRVFVKNSLQLEKNSAFNTECSQTLINVAQQMEKYGTKCTRILKSDTQQLAEVNPLNGKCGPRCARILRSETQQEKLITPSSIEIPKSCKNFAIQDPLEILASSSPKPEVQQIKEEVKKNLCSTLADTVKVMKAENTDVAASMERICAALEESNKLQKEMLTETKRHNKVMEKFKCSKLEQKLSRILGMED